jgi:hypothetical protein
MADTNVPRIVISQNNGETWRPLPHKWRQSGTILEANDTVVRQDAGGGHEVWYRLDFDDEPGETDGAPDGANVLGAFVASMPREDRDAIDAILENAQITPDDPRYAGIAVTMYTTAMLSRRIDQLTQR